MATGDAARIRAKLDHPVIDGDGHWIESLPVLVDYLAQVAGGDMAEQYRRAQSRRGAWYEASWDERRARRLGRGNWWITTADTFDFATAMLPGLMAARMDELGLDYGIVYPTRCLGANTIAQDDLRQALCRAYNTMVADVFADHRARLTPAALIPCYTPREAIAELDHAIQTLGLKAASCKGSIPRPVPAFATVDRGPSPVYIDALGLDNPTDYDPLWQRCADLGVAVTIHQASNGWPTRSSFSNGEFNRLGHAADAHVPVTKALFLGGVVRRFPNVTFAFLEGGVAYAVELLCNLLGGWEKRHFAAMEQHLKPTNIDVARLGTLIAAHGYRALQDKGSEAIDALQLEDLVARETAALDDYAELGVQSGAELSELFARNFYFGCEADDATTLWGFDRRMPRRLKAILGTDVGHWDVTDFDEVLPETWELVEHELIERADFKELTFANAVELHTRMNPRFFDGTRVEGAVEAHLAGLRIQQ
jgi:predicted TIM-barrel fold metal-dependent hydrolase